LKSNPPRDALDEPFDLLQLGFGQSPKLDVALLVLQEDRVRREGMEVGAAVQSAPAEIPGQRHASRTLGLLEERRAGWHRPGPQGTGFSDA
jgi:hypothetical protein